jgi:hypothetical protein
MILQGHKQLFEQVLIKPSKLSNKLQILSGFASSAMAFHHLEYLKRNNKSDIKIDLIVGMTPIRGINKIDHNAFKKIMSDYPTFSCSYLTDIPPVHSKVYTWFKDDEPTRCFIGSANYSQLAFTRGNQSEILYEIDGKYGKNYIEKYLNNSIYCNHLDADSIINNKGKAREDGLSKSKFVQESLIQKVSLLSAKNTIHTKGGLNWGQREGRNKNQAYIPINGELRFKNYFPETGIHFSVLTDDDKTFICTRAQQNGKAIETPHNNSLLGEYFRYRLGLENGAFVSGIDLENYGRTDVTFQKIDDETFYMDFSVEKN